MKEIDLVLDPLIQQHGNQKIFQSILLSIAEHDVDAHQSRKVTLTKDEENIIRYAAGYVPLALLRKKQKGTSEKSSQFLDCLSGMADDGKDASFETYTTDWITAIDRGGLFHIKDDVYLLFREIEEFTRSKLTSLLKSLLRDDDRKKRLIQNTVADPCISRLWRALSADLEENLSIELLADVVDKWLTIRGFSIAGHWMELYKASSKAPSKGSLRRTLKKAK